ncbi:coatomer epsilon subunit-domain-containing protein [Irpex rosettiformis]|uniref:Coatomer epsilon subunit-domain-containing protein n=1 Tax=Irpex rosettiformis TaxID=378272 RepID=A0ACB8UBQ8_9APHY|nr:coatomer epsilon subunit-domain-containing protein [Irpex rosettiformis]
MESSELYHVKQQFILGAYQSLTSQPLPPSTSPDFLPTLIYQARAHIALSAPSAALSLLSSSLANSPELEENVAVKAVNALAKYVESPGDTTLEELRDLAVEVDSDEDEDAGDREAERDRWTVRVLAATAFARAGEVEEALETVQAGRNKAWLEATAVTVQLYLSIHRADLARAELTRAKKWSEDDLLLQHIEATISLATGADAYADCNSFYTEQLANPSLSSPHLFVARGVTRILMGEVEAAKSDFEEVKEGERGAETLGALVVADELAPTKGSEEVVEKLWSQLASKYPTFPLVTDTQQKSELFDELATKFTVPPLAVAAAAE